MTFVARPPSSEIEAPPADEQPIVNDGFFPDIEPDHVREAARIPTSITPARLRAAIVAAILTVGIDADGYRVAMTDAGHDTLADVPAAEIDGESVQLLRYRRAIALYAKAELIERHRDFDSTAAGGAQAEELTPSIGELRRDAQHAVRDMLGRTRIVVDLI